MADNCKKPIFPPYNAPIILPLAPGKLKEETLPEFIIFLQNY
jgi:hypothetical protein